MKVPLKLQLACWLHSFNNWLEIHRKEDTVSGTTFFHCTCGGMIAVGRNDNDEVVSDEVIGGCPKWERYLEYGKGYME